MGIAPRQAEGPYRVIATLYPDGRFVLFCRYIHTPAGHGPWANPCKSLTEYTNLLQDSFKLDKDKRVNLQINRVLFSAHSSFGFYLTLTIQNSGTTTCL